MDIQVRPNVTSYDYIEVGPSPEVDWDPQNIRAQRNLQCNWADRYYLAQQLLGHSTWAGGSTIHYMLPQAFPDSYGLYCNKVRIQPFGAPIDSGDTKIMAYTKSRLVVSYKPVPLPESGGAPQAQILVSESIDPVAEFLTMPNRKLYWDNAQAVELSADEAPGIIIHMVDWVYTIHQLPYIPSEVFTKIGYCNSASVVSKGLGKTFEAETLLYNPPSASREIDSFGFYAWSLTMRFTYRPQGWNKFPKAGEHSLDFRVIYNSGGDPLKIYPTTNLGDLIV